MIIAFYPGSGGSRYLNKILNREWQQLYTIYDHTHNQKLSSRYLLDDRMILSKFKNDSHILTHCCNLKRIKQMFPDRPITFIQSNLKESLRREWILAGHNRFVEHQMTVKNNISRLTHYQEFKDLSWPEINDINQLNFLPSNILVEVNDDYEKVLKNNIHKSNNTLEFLKKTFDDKINSSYEIISWHLDYYKKYPVDLFQSDTVVEIDKGIDSFSILMKQELNLYSSEIFDTVWKELNA